VDGTFMPNTNAATPATISTTALTYDFSAETSYGNQYGAWYNGANGIDNPSGAAGLPNFTGDSSAHSLLAGHATKGITFDLDAVRSTGASFNAFTAYLGDSRPKANGSISYYLLVDGTLKANRNDVTNSEDFVAIPLAASDRFLTIVFTDARIADINSDHSYAGDPFLRTASVWTGGGSDANWSTAANWADGIAPTSGATADIILTGDTNVGGINQDIAAPFQLNRLQIAGYNPDGSASTSALVSGGSQIQFVANGSVNPELAVSRNQTATINNNVNIANDLTLMVLNGSAANDLVVSGQVSGSGMLTKTGPGTVVFNGTNGGFAGNVVVDAGTLVLDRYNSPPLGVGASRTATINPGATLTATVGGHNPFGTGTDVPTIIINQGTMNSSQYQHTMNLVMTGGTIQPTGAEADGIDLRGSPSNVTINAYSSQATIASKMTVRNQVIFNVADGAASPDLVVSGALAGGGELVKSGAGTMFISRSNSGWTGRLKVDAGTVVYGASNIIATSSRLHNNWGGGGTVDFNGFNQTVAGLGGNPTLTNSSATLSTFTTAGGSWDYGGRSPGNLAIVKTGSGWQRFQTWSTYTGGTTVDGGTLYLRGGNNGESSVGPGTLTINAGANVVCESHNVLGHSVDARIPHVVINGGTLTPYQYLHVKTIEMTGGLIADSGTTGAGLDWQHGANTLTTHASADTATVAARMTLTRDFTAAVEDGAADADLLVSGSIVAGGKLIKTGGGTMVLTGSNGYTGATDVLGGTLLVNGTNSGTGLVTVAGGATLGGTGTIAGAVQVQGGAHVAPGASIGTLTTGSATFAAESFFDVQLNPTEWDVLSVVGDVDLNNPILNLLDLSSFSHYQGSEYLILANDGTDPITGTFLDLPEGASFEVGGNQFAITYIGGEGNNDVVLTSVPEPATGLMLALALPAVAARLRRRRSR